MLMILELLMAPALAGSSAENMSAASSLTYRLIAIMLGRLEMTIDECIES